VSRKARCSACSSNGGPGPCRPGPRSPF
jgi:hypothetical protein